MKNYIHWCPIFEVNHEYFIGLARWRLYAIYRLEHWGLQFVNNTEITDEDIMEANRTYGSLGELAIMVLPQSQIIPLIKKFELGNSV